MSTRKLHPALLLTLVLLSGSVGCEAVATFDRGKIPGPATDAGQLRDAALDAGTDAQLDAAPSGDAAPMHDGAQPMPKDAAQAEDASGPGPSGDDAAVGGGDSGSADAG